MKLKSEQIERILWILAISLALLLRLLKLGAAPLTDWEASNALPVFQWVKSGAVPAGSQAAYTLFSGLTFFLTGASTYAARLIPALTGSLLVLAPLAFRRQLGRWPALMFAFGLALDPLLVAISRQADGSIWAIAFTLFALGFLLNRRSVLAGICFGLALLGGPSLWLGWLGLGLALVASFRKLSAEDVGLDAAALRSLLPTAGIAALATLAAAGTLFLFAPFGLSMAAGSLPDFFRSWAQTGAFSIRNATIALLSYATLPLLLGILQGVTTWTRKDVVDQFLTMWVVMALLLWFANPGRQMGDAGWFMLPLWALAARQLAAWLRKPGFDVRFSAAMAVVVFVLLFFTIMSAVALLHPSGTTANADLQIVKILVALVLLGLTIVLVGWGWDWDAAGQGVKWGVGAVLCLVLVAMTLRASGLSPRPQAELLRSGAYAMDADLMQTTLRDLSKYKTGQPNDLSVSVVGIQSPSLEWLLRDFSRVQYSDSISTLETPDIILTSDVNQPGQVSTYRGQDFVWAVRPAWNQMIAVNWTSWLVFREYPEEKTKIILWARTDLFPGESANSTTP